MGWWAGRHHRRRAREASGEAARLEREVAAPARRPSAASPGAASGPAPRDQRAIERQSALVAAELSRRPARAAPSREDPVGRRGRCRSRRPRPDRPPRRAVPRRLRDAAAPSSHDCRADRPRLGRRHAAADAGLDARPCQPSRHQGGHGLPRQRQALAALDLRPVPAARRHDRPDGGAARRHHADQAAHRLRLGAGLALPVAARCAAAADDRHRRPGAPAHPRARQGAADRGGRDLGPAAGAGRARLRGSFQPRCRRRWRGRSPCAP